MGFFDNIRNAVAAGGEKIASGIGRFRNRAFLEGVVGGAVLIASADGHIDPEEKTKLLNFIKASSDLDCFNPSDVAEIFGKIEKLISFDADSGKAEAFRLLGKLRDNPEQARMAARACIAIAGADGNFDDEEKAMARQICKELGINPEDFGL